MMNSLLLENCAKKSPWTRVGNPLSGGWLLTLLFALIFSSCNHKELCYLHPHPTKLMVVYDWSDAPEANVGGMCAFFYSEDRPGEYHRFDFPGGKGGEIELPAGRYVLVTYNNDTEAVQFFAAHTFEGHAAYTREGDILEPMYGNGIMSSVRAPEGERVVITPDELYGCTATEIDITEHGIEYIHGYGYDGNEGRSGVLIQNEDQVITLYPHDLLCHYSYEVRNVKNAKHVTRISGAISGMAGMLTFNNEELHNEPVTLPVPGNANGEAKTVTGEFLTFGHHESVADPHKMTFYVVMDDGAKYSFSGTDNLNVTEQVHSAPNRRRVHLIIDGLDLPQPIENGNGFNPSIEDWGVVEEDIIM